MTALGQYRYCPRCGIRYEVARGMRVDGLCADCRAVLNREERAVWETPRKPVPRAQLPGDCRRGHAYTPENTIIHSTRGTRICRACKRITDAEWVNRRREQNRRAA